MFFAGNDTAGIANTLRHLFGRTAANTASAGSVSELDSKTDGGCNLKNNLWKIVGVGHGSRVHTGRCVAEIRSKDAYVAFTAKHNNLLVINGNTAEFLRLTVGDGSLKANSEVESDINRKVSSVESHITDGYVCPDYVGTLAPDACCVVDCRLTVLVKKYSEIFYTVLVSCRIIYFINVYAR